MWGFLSDALMYSLLLKDSICPCLILLQILLWGFLLYFFRSPFLYFFYKINHFTLVFCRLLCILLTIFIANHTFFLFYFWLFTRNMISCVYRCGKIEKSYGRGNINKTSWKGRVEVNILQKYLSLPHDLKL